MKKDKIMKIVIIIPARYGSSRYKGKPLVKILNREMNLDQAGDALIDVTVKTANGRLTCAEALGHREFIITKLYRSA